MKYYLFEVAEGDAKIAGKAAYQYDSRDAAVANFHSKLGTAMKSELYISELVIVSDENGGIECVEKWSRE